MDLSNRYYRVFSKKGNVLHLDRDSIESMIEKPREIVITTKSGQELRIDPTLPGARQMIFDIRAREAVIPLDPQFEDWDW